MKKFINALQKLIATLAELHHRYNPPHKDHDFNPTPLKREEIKQFYKLCAPFRKFKEIYFNLTPSLTLEPYRYDINGQIFRLNEALRNARDALRTRSKKLYRIYAMNAYGYLCQTSPLLLERIKKEIEEKIREKKKEEEKQATTPENDQNSEFPGLDKPPYKL